MEVVDLGGGEAGELFVVGEGGQGGVGVAGAEEFIAELGVDDPLLIGGEFSGAEEGLEVGGALGGFGGVGFPVCGAIDGAEACFHGLVGSDRVRGGRAESSVQQQDQRGGERGRGFDGSSHDERVIAPDGNNREAGMSRWMTTEAFAGQYETCMVDRENGWARGLVGLGMVGLLTTAAALVRPAPAAAFADGKEAGAELFATRGCTHCHGADGMGTDKGPSLRDLRKKLKDGQVREQIVHGGQGMPAFGDSLKDEEVDELVSFLRAKKWVTPPAVVHPVEAGSLVPKVRVPSAPGT